MCLRDPKRLSNLSDQSLWNRRTGDDGETLERPVQRFLVIEARVSSTSKTVPVSSDDGEADDKPETVEEWDGGANSIGDFEIHCVADEVACVVDSWVCQG